MIVAKEKRKNNIAEYILYMWHIEDLLRACNLEFSVVKQKIISGYKTDATTLAEISDWYQDLIHTMINEEIAVKGHFQFLIKLIDDLNNLHLELIADNINENYLKFYNAAKPNIELFRSRSDSHSDNDIKICLNALYSLLLLKISKKEISTGTMESINTFSSMLSLLSMYYKKMEEGKM
jgi:Domain of unknown function (DUF4924)